MRRTCNKCGDEKVLSALNFKTGENNGKQYFTNSCRKCCYKMATEKRKEVRHILRPSSTRMYVKQAIIGSKTEPYFIGEDYEYIAPTYAEILNEYK